MLPPSCDTRAKNKPFVEEGLSTPHNKIFAIDSGNKYEIHMPNIIPTSSF